MLDFNHRTTPTERLGEIIDQAFVRRHAEQPVRDYLGASVVGESCVRRIQYQYFNAPRDDDKAISAQTLRIFARGHIMEAAMAEWLRQAGFDLRTHNTEGGQFGFALAGGKIKGHADGVIVAGPEGFAYPMLWENKALGAKAWKEVNKHKLAVAKPVYAAQVALYQTYLDLHQNPALFTAINCDTMEIYIEMVPFDAALAQAASDKAVNIIRACDAGELLPRITSDSSWFECQYCPWQDRCWRPS